MRVRVGSQASPKYGVTVSEHKCDSRANEVQQSTAAVWDNSELGCVENPLSDFKKDLDTDN